MPRRPFTNEKVCLLPSIVIDFVAFQYKGYRWYAYIAEAGHAFRVKVRLKVKPALPKFDASIDTELRALWREYSDLQVRWLIPEILALRKSIDKVQSQRTE